jgi:hypothetical protein
MEWIFISEEYKDQNQTEILKKWRVSLYLKQCHMHFSLYGCAQCTNFTAVAVTVYGNIKEKKLLDIIWEVDVCDDLCVCVCVWWVWRNPRFISVIIFQLSLLVPPFRGFFFTVFIIPASRTWIMIQYLYIRTTFIFCKGNQVQNLYLQSMNVAKKNFYCMDNN